MNQGGSPSTSYVFDRMDSTQFFLALYEDGPSLRSAALEAASGDGLRSSFGDEDLWAVAEMGYHYARSGGPRLARVIFEGLSVLRPDWAYVWLGLGLACDRCDDTSSARRGYERAIRCEPTEPIPWLNLAELELRDGNKVRARCLLAGLDRHAGRPQDATLRSKRRLLGQRAEG